MSDRPMVDTFAPQIGGRSVGDPGLGGKRKKDHQRQVLGTLPEFDWFEHEGFGDVLSGLRVTFAVDKNSQWKQVSIPELLEPNYKPYLRVALGYDRGSGFRPVLGVAMQPDGSLHAGLLRPSDAAEIQEAPLSQWMGLVYWTKVLAAHAKADVIFSEAEQVPRFLEALQLDTEHAQLIDERMGDIRFAAEDLIAYTAQGVKTL